MAVCVRGYSLLRVCGLVQEILRIYLRSQYILHLRFWNLKRGGHAICTQYMRRASIKARRTANFASLEDNL